MRILRSCISEAAATLFQVLAHSCSPGKLSSAPPCATDRTGACNTRWRWAPGHKRPATRLRHRSQIFDPSLWPWRDCSLPLSSTPQRPSGYEQDQTCNRRIEMSSSRFYLFARVLKSFQFSPKPFDILSWIYYCTCGANKAQNSFFLISATADKYNMFKW